MTDNESWAATNAKNYRTSLRCWWSRDFGWLSLLDPFSGEVIEVAYPDPRTPKWMVWRAMDEKARRQGTSSGSRPGG